MAAYTIFSQADPFPHNEYFLELLNHPAMLGKVQTLSRLYLSEGQFETPKAAGQTLSHNCGVMLCSISSFDDLYDDGLAS